jgi:hypothetical protein
MSYNQGLGDVASDIAQALENLRRYAQGLQTGGDTLAQKIQEAGDTAVRLSNAVTGAVAGANYGAKAGYNAPMGALPSWIVPTALGVGAYLLLRSRR